MLDELGYSSREPEQKEASPQKEEEYVEIVYQRNDTEEDEFNNRN